MVLLLSALLCATPTVAPPPEVTARSAKLRAKVDVVGMIFSYWYVPQSRTHIEAALNNAKGSFLDQNTLNGEGLLMATPVVGPWLAAGEDSLDGGDRALLYTSGILQLVGLSLGAMRLFQPNEGPVAKGPVLSVSPITAGRLGLSVRIVGF